MASIEGGRVFWFPSGAFRLPDGSDAPERVTDDVMSYEVDGELRLSNSIGTLGQADITFEPEGGQRG
jgi:hypothetical protein